MSNYRSNDGLDASNTTDAYGDNNTGGRDTYRSNDGLDSSGTSDAYNQTSSGGGNYRSNDGLDASGTSDAYGDSGSGNSGGRANRTTDGLDPSGTSDAYGDSGTMYGRRTDSEAQEKTPGGKVGGLGYDSSGQRGGDQETSEHTSGGLGADDTYGDEADTGGADTGYDHNYGMGTGRTVSQEEGGPLPTEAGRDDIKRQGDDYDDRLADYKPEYRDDQSGSGYGNGSGYSGDNAGAVGSDTGTGGKNKDSTMGKMMEKAGGMLKNENLMQKGQEKRQQAGQDY